jgi:hypothetical protein
LLLKLHRSGNVGDFVFLIFIALLVGDPQAIV